MEPQEGITLRPDTASRSLIKATAKQLPDSVKGSKFVRMNEGEFIHTPRLKLIPAISSLVQAELRHQVIFFQLLGAQTPKDWPPEFIIDALPHFLKQLEQNPELVGCLSWYWILVGKAGKESVLIGSGGFKDRPQPDGTVEVGYSVLPQHQSCGYASEAVGGLLCWVFAHGEVARVIADLA